MVAKQPLAAFEDQAFAREAREVCSRTFVAHVRYASTGGLVTPEHPPVRAARPAVRPQRRDRGPRPRSTPSSARDRRSCTGDTDSERFFALITREIERAGGDVGAGSPAAAALGGARTSRCSSLNFVLITADELWALRYPDTHELYVLERAAGGPSGGRHLEHASARGTVRVRSGELARAAGGGRRHRADGRGPGLAAAALRRAAARRRRPGVHRRRTVLDRAPAHRLTLADLDPQCGTQVPGRERPPTLRAPSRAAARAAAAPRGPDRRVHVRRLSLPRRVPAPLRRRGLPAARCSTTAS